MPQYILIAYDAKDAEAPNRRMAMREAHLESVKKARANGNALAGLAIIENEKMAGSVIVTNFDSRAEFDAWLAVEPYITGKVWDDITVLDAKIGPSFEDLIQKAI